MGLKSGDKETALAEFFQAVANAFLQGDHVWLSEIYTYPLVIYIEGEIVVERTREETLGNLFARREAVLRAGAKSIISSIEDIGPENAGRFPVRVNWKILSEAGNILAESELRYFCRFDPEGRARIEILEFIKRGIATLSSGKSPSLH